MYSQENYDTIKNKIDNYTKQDLLPHLLTLKHRLRGNNPSLFTEACSKLHEDFTKGIPHFFENDNSRLNNNVYYTSKEVYDLVEGKIVTLLHNLQNDGQILFGTKDKKITILSQENSSNIAPIPNKENRNYPETLEGSSIEYQNLKHQIISQNNQIKTLELYVREKDTVLENQQLILEKLESNNSDLISKLKTQDKNYKEKIQDLKDQIVELEEKILEIKIPEIEKNLKKLEKTNKYLNSKLDQLESKNENLISDYNDIDKKYQEEQDKNLKLEDQIKNLKQQQQQEIKTNLKNLEQENTKLNKKLKELELTNTTLGSELNNAKETFTSESKKNQELTTQTNTLTNENREIKEKLKASKQKEQDLQINLNIIQLESNQKDEKIKINKEYLEKYSGDAIQLRFENTMIGIDLNKKIAEISEKEIQIQNLKKEYQSQIDANNLHMKEIKSKNQIIEQKNQELQTLAKTIESLQQHIENLETEKNSIKDQVKEISTQVPQVQEENKNNDQFDELNKKISVILNQLTQEERDLPNQPSPAPSTTTYHQLNKTLGGPAININNNNNPSSNEEPVIVIDDSKTDNSKKRKAINSLENPENPPEKKLKEALKEDTESTAEPESPSKQI